MLISNNILLICTYIWVNGYIYYLPEGIYLIIDNLDKLNYAERLLIWLSKHTSQHYPVSQIFFVFVDASSS